MTPKSSAQETEVICFVINECSAFFIGLKEKLDGMGLFDGGLKVKKPGKTSAFNLWVKEEMLDKKKVHPEGTKEGPWRMAEACKSWQALSADEKAAYADSQKEVLEALNGSKTSLAPKKAVEVPAAEKAIPAANEAAEVTVAAEKNRKKKRKGDQEKATTGKDGLDIKRKKNKKTMNANPTAGTAK